MGETIRDVIRRRVRRLIVAGLAGWLVFMTAVSLTHKGAPIPMPNLLLLLAGVGTFGGALLKLSLIRCPACHGSLNQSSTVIAFPSLSRRKLTVCPLCDANLDEPLPEDRLPS